MDTVPLRDDDSDNEDNKCTRTDPTSPISPYPPVRAEQRSRAPEFYGFVAWTSTSLAFVLYILWALLPDRYILCLGIDWYPSREWAILLPAWSVVVILTTYFVYFAIAIAATPSFTDLNAITDDRALHPRTSALDPYLHSARGDSAPELYDIPIGLVNRVLYPSQPVQASS